MVGPAGQEDASLAAAWVLMRVAGDPDGRVLVYDRFEWECFLMVPGRRVRHRGPLTGRLAVSDQVG